MVKFVRRDLNCYGDIPSGYQAKCEKVIEVLGEMITGSDTGWVYDTRTPAGTLLSIRSYNNTYQWPIKYFRNTESGAKLMILVFSTYNNSSYSSNGNLPYMPFKNYLCCQRVNSYINSFNTGNYQLGQYGICMSIIPPGSESEYPSTIDAGSDVSIIPNDAIPLVPETQNYNQNSTVYDYSTLGSITSGDIVSFGLILDSERIVLLIGKSSTGTRRALSPVYALGKIIGTLTHESDSLSTSQYGAVRFAKTSLTDIKYYNNANGINIDCYGRLLSLASGDTNNGSLNNTENSLGFFFKADGSKPPYNGTYVEYGVDGGALCGSSVIDTSQGNSRWYPFSITQLYTPATTNGVVPGDNFKGYLDTNLFRFCPSTKGNFYNNGQFVAFENNLLVAWDPDATDTIM